MQVVQLDVADLFVPVNIGCERGVKGSGAATEVVESGEATACKVLGGL